MLIMLKARRTGGMHDPMNVLRMIGRGLDCGTARRGGWFCSSWRHPLAQGLTPMACWATKHLRY